MDRGGEGRVRFRGVSEDKEEEGGEG